MSFRNSPWSGRPKEGYFLIDDDHLKRNKPLAEQPRYLAVEISKDAIFDRLREAESRGIVCHVEDLKGNRLS